MEPNATNSTEPVESNADRFVRMYLISRRAKLYTELNKFANAGSHKFPELPTVLDNLEEEIVEHVHNVFSQARGVKSVGAGTVSLADYLS